MRGSSSLHSWNQVRSLVCSDCITVINDPIDSKEMQQAMASLAFLTGDPAQPVSVSTYEWLFTSERWAALRTSFLHDLLTVNGLSSEPMLPLLLHYGLASLKTTACGRQDHSLCPTCTAPLCALMSLAPISSVGYLGSSWTNTIRL